MATKKPEAILNFTYEGLDRKGKKTKGEMSGKNVALVKAQLRKQGINVNKIHKKTANPLAALVKPKSNQWMLLFLLANWQP